MLLFLPLYFDHLTSLVRTAIRTNPMGYPRLAAIRALRQLNRFNPVVIRSPLSPSHFGRFFLRNRHIHPPFLGLFCLFFIYYLSISMSLLSSIFYLLSFLCACLPTINFYLYRIHSSSRFPSQPFPFKSRNLANSAFHPSLGSATAIPHPGWTIPSKLSGRQSGLQRGAIGTASRNCSRM